MSDKEIASGLVKNIFNVGSLVANGGRDTSELEKAVQAFIGNTPFRVELLSPKILAEFLVLARPTQGIWNQMVNELGDKWLVFLNEIETMCFLNSENLAKVSPFISSLWADEVNSSEPLKPPANWQYFSVPEAIGAYKKIFGSSLNGSSTIERVKNLVPWDHSEGVGVWPKFSVLAKLLCSANDDPLADDEKGWLAYQSILKAIVSEKDGILPQEYKKVFPEFGYKNWRKDEMDKFFLTPAGRTTWLELEKQSDDDFIIASANSGSLYAGHSVRNARNRIVLSGNQGPQDAIMNSLTLAVQPELLCANDHLCIDCSGTMLALDGFSHVPYLYFSYGCLRFHAHRIDDADDGFGSSVVRLR